MAKYRLTKNPKKSVNCEVLQENLNGYIVRFDNGMIKNVNKKNVYAFDRIDEAVLNEGFVDDVKANMSKFGKKIVKYTKNVYNKIKDLLNGILKFGNTVFFKTDKGICNVSHPVNIMEFAKNVSSVNYIPSEDDIMMAKEIGAPVNVINNFTSEGEYSGSIDFTNIVATNESVMDALDNPLFEANASRWLSDREKVLLQGQFGDWSQEQIEYEIISEWASRYSKNKSVKGLLPLMIWGAPGIGKTSITRACVKKIKEQFGRSIRVISINGGSVGFDDFTMPAEVKQALNDYLTNGNRDAIEKYLAKNDNKVKSTIKDLPKSWLPVCDPTSPNYPEENAIANGGCVEVILDDEGNVVDRKIKNGPGGIFFIDEYSRFSQAAMNSLMQTPTSREIGSNSTLKFGDRWVIVCAANRESDMGRSKSKALQFEAASKTRFRHVNFVPKVQDWIKWATSDNGEGEPQILKDITDYILHVTAKGKIADFYEMYNFAGGELDVDRASACPRTWEAFSASLRNIYLKQDIKSDDDEDMSAFISFFNNRPDTLSSLDDETITRCGASIIGGDPTARFVNYLNNVTFTSTDAKNVVEKGGYDDKGQKIHYAVYDNITVAKQKNIIRNTIAPLLVEAINKKGQVTDEILLHVFQFAYALAHMKSSDKVSNIVFVLEAYNELVSEVLKGLNIKLTNEHKSRYPNAFNFNSKVNTQKA